MFFLRKSKARNAASIALLGGLSPNWSETNALIRRASDNDVAQKSDEPSHLPTRHSFGNTADNLLPYCGEKELRFNVGGVSYRISSERLLRHAADTLLGRLLLVSHAKRIRMCDGYDEEKNEYYFERLSRYFEPIYDFLITGAVHMPQQETVCMNKMMEELNFWRVPETKLAKCCSPFEDVEQDIVSVLERQAAALELIDVETGVEPPAIVDPFNNLRFRHIRRKVWEITEGTLPTRGYKLFELVSTSFIATSVVSLVFSSMPEFLIEREYTLANGTSAVEYIEPPFFQYVEYVCGSYFTIEYTLRLLVSPNKAHFVCTWLNLVDLVAIVPALFELLLLLCGITNDNVSRIRWALLTVRILRVIRILRVVKLARFNFGVSNFALTLKRSKGHMQMLAVVLLMVVTFFSTLIFFCEKGSGNPGFRSIPATFWWCVVTMTTVGYGDAVPITTLGKIFGIGAILCGVLVLALPITIMVTNFMGVVKQNEIQRLKKRREASISTDGRKGETYGTMAAPNYVEPADHSNRYLGVPGQ